MADVKIQDLLSATTVADTDLFIVEDNADTKKITKLNLINAIGGIVESGANSNGTYIKFADGTMICRKRYVVNSTYASGVHALTWVFPTSFLDGTDLAIVIYPAFASVTADASKLTYLALTDGGTHNTYNNVSVQANFNFSSATSFQFRPVGIAIGRWRA